MGAAGTGHVEHAARQGDFPNRGGQQPRGEECRRHGDERVHGSIALAVLAVAAGARLVRAHDVAATVDALKVAAAVIGGE